MTDELFREDAVLDRCAAAVVIDERGVQLGRTVFYPPAAAGPATAARRRCTSARGS